MDIYWKHNIIHLLIMSSYPLLSYGMTVRAELTPNYYPRALCEKCIVPGAYEGKEHTSHIDIIQW